MALLSGFPGGGDVPVFTDYDYGYHQLQLTEFSGHHDVGATEQAVWSWSNTGHFGHHQETPSGSRTRVDGYEEQGAYSLVNATGQVGYTGTGGGHYSMNGPDPYSYDHTGNAFAYTLQVDMSQLHPSLGAVNWNSATGEMIRSVTEAITLNQGNVSELIDEARLFWNDFGGNFQYHTHEIQHTVDAFRSGLYGTIDGFLDTVNPFDYYWSIPDIGPVAGHETAHTIGYVGGVTAGVGVQIGVGVLSGGATAPAAVASIAKLGLAVAKAYTVVDTMGAVATGIGIAANTYNNAGAMTGWQIAGDVAMAGLNGATGLGHLGGKALNKANVPRTANALDSVGFGDKRSSLLGKWLGSNRLNHTELREYEKQLGSYGVALKRGSEATKLLNKAGARAAFDSISNTVYLKKNATFYDAFHELQHVKHRALLGQPRYREIGELSRETYVFQQIWENRGMFNYQELKHAIQYLKDERYLFRIGAID